jgi:transcriptional regulator with XRE-family HTH domain
MLNLSQEELAINTEAKRTTVAGYEAGVSLPHAEFLIALNVKYYVDINWLLTGEGAPFLKQDIGASADDAPSAEKNVFEIPVLSKEQVLNFDPDVEIPERKANSGDYPDKSIVPVPWRILQYSTDLRAVTVFDSRMVPVLKLGDIAIFEPGHRGNGIQVYRMGGKLHITYAGVENNHFRLFSELDEEIPFDGETYFPIGCVRAVVNDLQSFDWPSTAKASMETILRWRGKRLDDLEFRKLGNN